jgi:hypothetical protein
MHHTWYTFFDDNCTRISNKKLLYAVIICIILTLFLYYVITYTSYFNTPVTSYTNGSTYTYYDNTSYIKVKVHRSNISIAKLPNGNVDVCYKNEVTNIVDMPGYILIGDSHAYRFYEALGVCVRVCVS